MYLYQLDIGLSFLYWRTEVRDILGQFYDFTSFLQWVVFGNAPQQNVIRLSSFERNPMELEWEIFFLKWIHTVAVGMAYGTVGGVRVAG